MVGVGSCTTGATHDEIVHNSILGLHLETWEYKMTPIFGGKFVRFKDILEKL